MQLPIDMGAKRTDAACFSRLALSLGLYNLFDKRYAQPAAVTNWQNSFEQDGRSVQIKLSYGF